MKRNKNNCDLQGCSLCRGCLKEWLPALDANRKTYDFKKGEPIFTEGEPLAGIYFLLSGKAKVHKRWGEEKELIVRFAELVILSVIAGWEKKQYTRFQERP
jgi:CRP/FNR family transcriptional regulator